MTNYWVDLTLTFEDAKAAINFENLYLLAPDAFCQDMRVEVDDLHPMDDNPCEVQMLGTTDYLPGKEQFEYLIKDPSVREIYMWYDGGDFDHGEVVWRRDNPTVVSHSYLPDEFKPREDPDNNMAYVTEEAFEKHHVDEEFPLESMWS